MVEHGISKTHFLVAIGDVNQKSWNSFMELKGAGCGVLKQPGAGNSAYYKAFYFLEKYRIMKGIAKTPNRILFEEEYPQGYSLKYDLTSPNKYNS